MIRNYSAGTAKELSRSGIANIGDTSSLLSDDVFELFRNLIYKTSGIKIGLQKKNLLLSRLTKRLKALNVSDFYDYYRLIRYDNDELINMLNCITTNTTCFFREGYHFEYLRRNVFPELIDRDEVIKIWSAGCSTGEEPYSIAITLCEAMEDINKSRGLGTARGFDIKILATDISTMALRRAETGIYEYEQISDLDPLLIKRYFLKGKGENLGMVMVRDRLRNMIRFRRLNLKDQVYPFKGQFHVIFCRNVMIYFDEVMKRHVLSMFYRYLHSEGYLFLGHAETLLEKDEFRPVYITVYRKVAHEGISEDR